jgi:hypothetical protein
MPLPDVCKDPPSYFANFIDIINNYASIYTNLVSGTSTTNPDTQLNDLYRKLIKQKSELTNKIRSIESSTERHNRDFVELGQSTVINTSSVRVLDDYTLWLLMFSYLLFALSIVFWYSHTHLYSTSSIAMSIGGMALVTFLLVVLAIIVL